MRESVHKYDVAISFLHQDESIALALLDALSPALEVFVYSKKQEAVAGTDGLDTFRSAFRSEALLTLVLYRKGWGETPWTRVEETAIKDRCLADGWRHLLFVMLEGTHSPPVWLPESDIRMDFGLYGLDQTAGAVKRRAEELGATLRQSTILDRSDAVAKRAAFRKHRDALLNSEKGVERAGTEVSRIFAGCCERFTQISERHPEFGLRFGHADRVLVVTTGKVSCRLVWNNPILNTVSRAELVLGGLCGTVLPPEERQTRRVVVDPQGIEDRVFKPDYSEVHGSSWRDESDDVLSSSQVADAVVELLLDLVEREGAGEFEHFRMR